jgi:hypothetical protein
MMTYSYNGSGMETARPEAARRLGVGLQAPQSAQDWSHQGRDAPAVSRGSKSTGRRWFHLHP